MTFYLGSAMQGLFSGAQDVYGLNDAYMNAQLKQQQIDAGNSVANAMQNDQAKQAAMRGPQPMVDANGNPITQDTTGAGAPNVTSSPAAPIDVNKVSQLPKNMQGIPATSGAMDRRGQEPSDMTNAQWASLSGNAPPGQPRWDAQPSAAAVGTGVGPYDQPSTIRPPSQEASALPIAQTGPGPDLSHVNNLPTGQTLSNWWHGRDTNYLPAGVHSGIPAPAPMQRPTPRPGQPTLAQPNSGLGAAILAAGGGLAP